MIEADRLLNVLPELQKQCARERSGMVLDGKTNPEIVSDLPGHLQECIISKGSVVIDSAGNVFSQPGINGKK